MLSVPYFLPTLCPVRGIMYWRCSLATTRPMDA